MIVTIHQPNFFPWVGFFDKAMKADVLVLLDSVPFTKGGYQNRVRVKGANGPAWLTVPVVTKGRFAQKTSTVEMEASERWRPRHLQTLRADYGKAPFFKELFPRVEDIYRVESALLADFCTRGIVWALELLDIRTRVVLASEFHIEDSASALLARLVDAVGGDEYLSGPSGKNYLDESMFRTRDIAVSYHQFKPFPYRQSHGPFEPGLSVLDYLLNVGPAQWWDVPNKNT